MWVISVFPKRVQEGAEKCIRIQKGYDAPERFVKSVRMAGPCIMVTNHNSPLKNGVRVWIETEGEIEVE